MKNLKKAMALTMAAAMAASLAACGGSSSSSTTAAAKTTAAAADTTAAAAADTKAAGASAAGSDSEAIDLSGVDPNYKIEFKLSHVFAPDEALTKHMQAIADSIREKSNGMVDITC